MCKNLLQSHCTHTCISHCMCKVSRIAIQHTNLHIAFKKGKRLCILHSNVWYSRVSLAICAKKVKVSKWFNRTCISNTTSLGRVCKQITEAFEPRDECVSNSYHCVCHNVGDASLSPLKFVNETLLYISLLFKWRESAKYYIAFSI